MGGIGKTTLSRSIYEGRVVVQHFDVLAWATVSQDYRTREILSQLVRKDGKGSSQMDEYTLGEKLHKKLSGRRYLIFLDDVWDIQVWDRIRRFFPSNNNGSRIIITTRISNYQVTDFHVITMGFLDENRSWSLFSKIVFGKEDCPVELKGIGKKIVKKCQGLPLSIVVIGGLLAKSQQSQEYWEYIAENLNSTVNSEDNASCLKILHMSYSQLPIYLKPCFLYMGVFPKDEQIHVPKLVNLWVAEGFLKPINGKIWEEIAEGYLKELINRNLVLVNKLGSIENVKFCYLHDLLRDLCLREAQKQKFYNVIRQSSLNIPQDLSTHRRIVIPINASQEEIINAMQFTSLTRTLIFDSMKEVAVHNFRLLRIMSCQYLDNRHFLEDKFQFVNSRCICMSTPDHTHIFPSSLNLLWNLHTLIIEGKYVEFEAPFEIWNMSQLRHLNINMFGKGFHLQYPTGDDKVEGRDGIIMENLQTLGNVINFKCCKEVAKRIPNIKELKVTYILRGDRRESGFNNFCHLQKLKSLQCEYNVYDEIDCIQNLTLPHSLKKLKLEVTKFQNWEDHMEKIGSLPCLEELSISEGFFKGCKWETVEGQFPKLKFLKIRYVRGLKYWITENSHFPRLEHLLLWGLHEPTEIPSEIGEILTLEKISLIFCRHEIIFSAKKIQEEREELYGEVSLHVRVETTSLKEKLTLASPSFQLG